MSSQTTIYIRALQATRASACAPIVRWFARPDDRSTADRHSATSVREKRTQPLSSIHEQATKAHRERVIAIKAVCAQELGLDLYQVDLSKVVSKYMRDGETCRRTSRPPNPVTQSFSFLRRLAFHRVPDERQRGESFPRVSRRAFWWNSVMHDWAAIAKTFAAFRESYSRPEARAHLETILGTAVGNDLVQTHAQLRKLLRADVEAALTELNLRNKHLLDWFDADDRACYSLSLTEELVRLANAPVLDDSSRAKIIAYAEHLRTPSPTKQQLLDSVVPSSRQYVGDAECITAASDYEHVVRDLLALAQLEPARVECTESNARRTLLVHIGGRSVTAEMRGDTDWVDTAPLLECLNALLPSKTRRRFYEVTLPEWGQELGVVFASSAEVARLRAAGLVEEE